MFWILQFVIHPALIEAKEVRRVLDNHKQINIDPFLTVAQTTTHAIVYNDLFTRTRHDTANSVTDANETAATPT